MPSNREVRLGLMSNEVGLARSEELHKIARVYCEAFPQQLRVRLGLPVCEKYLSAVMNHEAYRLVVVRRDGEILAFSVVNLDRHNMLSNNWLTSSWPYVLLYGLRHPIHALTHFESVTNRLVRIFRPKKKSAPPAAARVEKASRPALNPYIDAIGVSESARGQGLGKAILKDCVKRCADAGHKGLDLTVACDNKSAISLYESVGFYQYATSQNATTFVYRYDIRADRNEPDAAVE